MTDRRHEANFCKSGFQHQIAPRFLIRCRHNYYLFQIKRFGQALLHGIFYKNSFTAVVGMRKFHTVKSLKQNMNPFHTLTY